MSVTTPSTFTGVPAGTWTIDPAHSDIGFVARHLMVSKVRGHFGEVSGTVTIAEPLTDSRVEVSIAMSSVDSGNADRDTHLRSGDFFDVEAYPEMTFASTAFTGSELIGDLTIKGVTKSVTLTVDFGGAATDPWGNSKAGFEAHGTINRSDFGLNWNAPLEAGGVLVSDSIDLVLDIQLLRADA